MREYLTKLLAACPVRLVGTRALQGMDAERSELLAQLQAERDALADVRRKLADERTGAARLQARLGDARAEMHRMCRALEGGPLWLQDVGTDADGVMWRAVVTVEALRIATDRAKAEGQEETAEFFRQELVRVAEEVRAAVERSQEQAEESRDHADEGVAR